ncbi:Thiamin pyrophosphokinase [Sistotremastrum suecicum HHB10207 ss-3]|uniref:Thiamine pyrophosphokinase n=1 Tax=Sistotremastrum suecicum HHB10207 ss-3 TaxID=1314776 RepID=A0A166II02_9AGAM|nr:Thiamin pyrophosphokinase [Sistotremastrum suecicum HHB10207 ss-3]
MSSVQTAATSWSTTFLSGNPRSQSRQEYALIVLNQPFEFSLLRRLWSACSIKCCADGGANRLYDTLLAKHQQVKHYLPAFIKGDLDSIRSDVRTEYANLGVSCIEDRDQYSTDLMKCVSEIETREASDHVKVYDIVLLGGLSGRLDQTVHTLSYLHKLRKTRPRTFVVTDDNVGWVLDSGEHIIRIDNSVMASNCGLLPVGVQSTVLSTTGLRWNLNEATSSFDGMVSTSNATESAEVWIKTSEPIWWCIELQRSWPDGRPC